MHYAMHRAGKNSKTVLPILRNLGFGSSQMGHKIDVSMNSL